MTERQSNMEERERMKTEAEKKREQTREISQDKTQRDRDAPTDPNTDLEEDRL